MHTSRKVTHLLKKLRNNSKNEKITAKPCSCQSLSHSNFQINSHIRSAARFRGEDNTILHVTQDCTYLCQDKANLE